MITKTPTSAYAESTLVARLRSTGYLTIIDLDGTDDGPEESRKAVREEADKRGPIAFASARTEELMLSPEAYALSVERYGLARPRSHKSLEGYAHQLDPDALIPFGGVILVRQPDTGYAIDEGYASLMTKSWWKDTRRNLWQIDADHKIRNALAPIENDENYYAGLADVLRLDYRMQLDFSGPNAFADKMDVKMRVISARDMGILKNVHVIDESKPAKERFTIYLVPRFAPKERGIQHLIRQATLAAGMRLEDLSFMYAGDTLTDLRAGLYTGASARATFVLAGGSLLAPYLVGEKRGEPYAGEDLSWVLKRLRPIENQVGWYTFKVNGYQPRTVVIADEAFPGAVGADSLLAYFDAVS